MKKNTFEYLMIFCVAVILVILSATNLERYSPISLIPLFGLFLSGRLYYKEKPNRP